MRLNYYRFPENVDEQVLLENGCTIVLKDGYTVHDTHIPPDKREEVDYIDHVISGISVTQAKMLLKKYGGGAWTDHIDRDGSVFESTPITLGGNNSKHKYNHHL